MKYWLKLRKSENCILRNCYEQMIEENDKWIVNIKTELDRLGLSFLWDSNYEDKHTLALIEQKIKDIYIQEIRSEINNLE